MHVEAFDPDDIRDIDMKHMSESFEEFLDQLEHVMIIPEDIMKEHGKDIETGIEIIRKLIKKLKKGDASVFKDPEEWNSLV